MWLVPGDQVGQGGRVPKEGSRKVIKLFEANSLLILQNRMLQVCLEARYSLKVTQYLSFLNCFWKWALGCNVHIGALNMSLVFSCISEHECRENSIIFMFLVCALQINWVVAGVFCLLFFFFCPPAWIAETWDVSAMKYLQIEWYAGICQSVQCKSY